MISKLSKTSCIKVLEKPEDVPKGCVKSAANGSI
jgi:hypothetical protein